MHVSLKKIRENRNSWRLLTFAFLHRVSLFRIEKKKNVKRNKATVFLKSDNLEKQDKSQIRSMLEVTF